jgi:hypothetical protein
MSNMPASKRTTRRSATFSIAAAAAAAAAIAALPTPARAGTSTNASGQPTQQGAGTAAATISFSGQVALRNFSSSAGVSVLQPNASSTFYFGPTGTPVTYHAANNGATYVQLAQKNFANPDTGLGATSIATAPVTQSHSALRVEWHEQGSVQGLVDLVNDQVGYVGSPISNVASRGPSVSNPTWINGTSFTTGTTLNGHTLSGLNYGDTYDTSVYDRPSGRNLQNGQDRIQYSQGEYKTENFARVGAPTRSAIPGQAGFGSGNPVLLPAGTPLGLGNAGGRQSFQPESAANLSTDKVDPQSASSATYAAGPWNTAGADNIDSKQFAVTAVTYSANPGTGLHEVSKADARWLQGAGRFSNGANFNVVSRANDAGQRTVPAVAAGLDPSWATGENDSGNTSGTAAQNAQKTVGPDIRFSGKTSGTDARNAISQSRLAVGALSIAEARGAASNAPLRVLDVDFLSAGFSLNAADYKRVNYDNLVNFTYEGVLISHIDTVKAPNVPLLNAFRTQYQGTHAGALPSAAEEQTWWAARTSEETGIKGDQFGNVRSFVNNITNSIGTAGAGITQASANNPADALFASGYTIPQLLNFKREFDGGPITPNVLNAAQLAVQQNVEDNYGPLFTADGSAGSNVQTKGSSAYYTALNRTDVAPAINGTTADLSITVKDAAGAAIANGVDGPKGNWLFGNFRQNGTRDFAAVKESVNAALSLRAVDGAKNSIYTADGGVANATVVPALSGTPGWASTANTKGDLIVLGDFNTDGRFDGKDVDLLARGASLSDNGSTDQLTTASGPNFSYQVRNPNAKLNKNAALDYAQAATANLVDANQTFVRTSAQSATQAANDPTGANAFNKADVNRDGLVNRQDAAIVDAFVGKDFRSLDDQLSAVVATNVNAAGTAFAGDPTLDQTTPRRSISLVDVELTDGDADGNAGTTRITHVLADDDGDAVATPTSDFRVIRTAVGAALRDGNVNFDASVNLTDLNVVKQNFGGNNDKWSTGDFNYNGNTDLTDLNAVKQNFGQSQSLVASSQAASSLLTTANGGSADTSRGNSASAGVRAAASETVALAAADQVELVVNFATGEVRLVGTDADAAELNNYSVESASGALNPTGWNTLTSRNSSTGKNFSVLISSDGLVGEDGGFVAGGPQPTISIGSAGLTLGNLFDVGGVRDLIFLYGDENANTITGAITYVPEPASFGMLGLAAVVGMLKRRRRVQC